MAKQPGAVENERVASVNTHIVSVRRDNFHPTNLTIFANLILPVTGGPLETPLVNDSNLGQPQTGRQAAIEIPIGG